MTADLRVELQAEVDAPREEVYRLMATSAGLSTWLDAATLEPSVGGSFRARLRDAVAWGTVVAVDPPQHISWTWDWEDEPLGAPSVFALDAIDHGARTHVTLRHVGFPSARQAELHDALWRHWFERFRRAAETLTHDKVEVTHP